MDQVQGDVKYDRSADLHVWSAEEYSGVSGGIQCGQRRNTVGSAVEYSGVSGGIQWGRHARVFSGGIQCGQRRNTVGSTCALTSHNGYRVMKTLLPGWRATPLGI